MVRRVGRLFAAFSCVAALSSTAAIAGNCTPPCNNVTASVRPTSVIPNPEDSILLGEDFQDLGTVLNLSGNGSQLYTLPENLQFHIGSQAFNSFYVNENGLLSFGEAIPSGEGFQQVESLTQFDVPVIAPFYADLQSNPDQTENRTGNVVVQVGRADPYAVDGVYQQNDFVPAVRITWNGLPVNGFANDQLDGFTNNELIGLANNQQLAYVGVLLTFNGNTDSFEFLYGQRGDPYQAGDGSIAGFALGPDAYQFHGPYTTGVPTYFELDDGRLVGNLAGGSVPEPATWLEMLLGFAILGAVARRRLPIARVAS